MKVAVVSVVGAFRTGKSFLLTFLLRYLRHGSELDESEDWMTAAGDLREGNINEKVLAGEAGRSNVESSFQWRAGKERTTTGIWMWSEPFVRRVANGEEVAVLLMDTQGMFDNETSMNLTACIFGLSTLLSSYQIYNVQNRIQEDNLQHLALFSEYGRIALAGEAGKQLRKEQSTTRKSLEKREEEVEEEEKEGGEEEEDGDEMMLPDDDEIPFQRVEFLVRDWMDFDEELPFYKLKVCMCRSCPPSLPPSFPPSLFFFPLAEGRFGAGSFHHSDPSFPPSLPSPTPRRKWTPTCKTSSTRAPSKTSVKPGSKSSGAFKKSAASSSPTLAWKCPRRPIVER